MGLKSFEEEIEGKKFKNPETGNEVVFKSLPLEAQKKLRGMYEKAKKKEEGGKSGKETLEGVLEATANFKVDKSAIEESIIHSSRWSESLDKFMKEQINAVASSFGLEGKDFKGVENLSDEDLLEISETIREMGYDMEQKYKRAHMTLKGKVKRDKKKLEESEKSLEYLSGIMTDIEDRLGELGDIEKGSDRYKRVEKRFNDLDRQSKELYDQILGLEKEAEIARKAEVEISSQFTTGDILKALTEEGARREDKKMKEEKARIDKEEQERKEKIKNQTKKLTDLQSRAGAVKSLKDLPDLFSEFGRIKGQLVGSNFESDMKSEIDKTEKALQRAQESTSLIGKFKNFFGLGKKASLSEDQIMRLKCELAHERAYLMSLKKTAGRIKKR